MPWTNDFECSECGEINEIMTDKNVDHAPCPDCGEDASKVFVHAPSYHQSIEMFLEEKRGHLHGKIKKSMQREAAMKQAVETRRSKPPWPGRQ